MVVTQLITLITVDCKLCFIVGQSRVYSAVDEGNVGLLGRCRVQKDLHLKVDANVVLLQNLTEELVNGLKGTVQHAHVHVACTVHVIHNHLPQ